MLIEIQEFNQSDRSVAFRSDLGVGHGIWPGDAPSPGERYDVELELPARLVWGTDIVPTPSMPPTISQNGEYVALQAVIETIDDNVAVLRLGDSLVMAEMTCPAAAAKGTPVRVTTPVLTLHPTQP